MQNAKKKAFLVKKWYLPTDTQEYVLSRKSKECP